MSEICECGQTGIFVSRQGRWRCSKSPNSCPATKEKRRLTCIEKYGVENISQLQEILDKKKSTWYLKYGVDNPSKADVNINKIKASWPEIERKRKATMMEKYGVDSYSKTEEFHKKRKDTWMSKYGVDNPAKNDEIKHKIMTSNSQSEYRTNTMILPSGAEIRYQGFENLVIQDLLDEGFSEDDIVFGPGKVPHIQYTFEGKLRRYYPDIFIPKLNRIIEVKSPYTWQKYLEKNLAKKQACLDAGYDFLVVIKKLRK